MFRRNIIREYEAKYSLLKDQRDEAEVKFRSLEIDHKNLKVKAVRQILTLDRLRHRSTQLQAD